MISQDMPSAPLTTLSPEEVALHRTESSCWVIVGINVYDVTTFLDSHPGGDDLILEYGGRDVSKIMLDELSHSHSEAAYEILSEYLVGSFAVGPDEIVPLGLTISSEGRGPNEDNPMRFLDLSKPLLAQLWNGGFAKDFYLEQVHRPRHYPGETSAPLFGNFLEPLSLTPWWVVPFAWLPIVVSGTYLADQGLPSSTRTAEFWLIGYLLWPLIEYGMHRWVFHLDK